MPAFVRFIFLMLVLGVAMNLAIVLVSNAKTSQRQIRDLAAERARFADLIKILNNQLRRGEIAVEWQRVDANQKVVETSLLVRQFMPAKDGAAKPLPTTRIIIPGDRICIDGLELHFDDLFNPEYAELRDTTLFQFDHIYADGTPAATQFSFLTKYEVPPAMSVSSTDKDPRPTYFENKLWQTVWEIMLAPEPQKRGLTKKTIEPFCSVVHTGSFYQITVGLEGITIAEDSEGLNRTDREKMLEEAQSLK